MLGFIENTPALSLINKVRSAQLAGKTLIATSPTFGLPVINNLSRTGDLTIDRRSDAFVCEHGAARYDSGIGMYVFTPYPGKEIPEKFKSKTLVPAEAVLELDTCRLIIPYNDEEIIISGIDPVSFKDPRSIMINANADLQRDGIPVVIWKITPKGEPRLRYYAGHRLSNEHTSIALTGAAVHNAFPVYLGVMGYKTSVDSIKATLGMEKYLTFSFKGIEEEVRPQTIPLQPAGKYVTKAVPMPEHSSHHACFVSKQAVPGSWQHGDQFAYALSFDDNGGADLVEVFTERLKESLQAPVKSEWGPAIWKAARARKFVELLTIYGDCSGGAAINLASDWNDLLQTLAQEELIVL